MILIFNFNCLILAYQNILIILYVELASWNFDKLTHCSVQFSHSVIRVPLIVTTWTAACQASLSITNSWSLLKLMSIESVMPSNHLILCCPLHLLPSIFSRIRIIFNESVLHMKWPKYWSLSQHQSFQWIFRTNFLQDWKYYKNKNTFIFSKYNTFYSTFNIVLNIHWNWKAL